MNNGANNTLNVWPSVDAIAEVRAPTSNYGARYGRNGSATIETATKSWTRDFHGDLYESFETKTFVNMDKRLGLRTPGRSSRPV